MKTHKTFEDKLLLYFYDELNADDIKLFEKHLSECSECTGELNRLNGMKHSLQNMSHPAPSSVLIERANAKIMTKIRQTKQRKFKWTLSGLLDDIQDTFTSIFARPRYQLISIGITFIIGIFVGKLWLSSGLRHDPGMLANFVNYQVALSDTEKDQFKKALANYLLQSGGIEVSELVQGPSDDDGDGLVEVNIRVDKDIAVKGGLDDPTILNMLQYSAIHEKDKTRRSRAIKLLSKTPQNPNNEATMISVILNDAEQEVRDLALDALTSYKVNTRIMDAYKTIALRDSSTEIRSTALEQLYKNADKSVVPILALIASNDSDTTLRNTAQKYLDKIVENK
ncbi:MAG: HEAT repeat domain-containing protein [Candidatus Marinimicrobia bacterium]|nr:HEAT repeat domain-containing protein [Candidatus Neomarinimicrobiota bacterium]